MTKFKYVGRPVPRVDAMEKVTGSAVFTDDIELPGMLHTKLLRSPHPHARIVETRTDRAEAVEGVVSVVTGRDFPFKLGIYVGDRDVLATEKALWVGQPVAAVVAETEAIAEKAVQLIEVEYENLEAVFDARKAMEEDAPIIHERLGEYRTLPIFSPRPGTNIASVFTLKKGDIEKGFAEADLIVENEFSLPQVSHAYMETMCFIARHGADGNVEIWSSSQPPFIVRYLTSMSLDIPLSKIVVHAPYVGGGFGGKAGLNFEPLTVLLSKASGNRPVKLRLTREEHFTVAAIRPGLHATVKTGVKKDGRIVAEKIVYVFDAGANADYAVNVGRAAGYDAIGPYDIPNVEAESFTVYTNKLYATAFRGFGHMELHWAIERQRDIIAKKLGMDPIEFRAKNVLKPGISETGTGARLREDAANLEECLRRVGDALEWGKKPAKPKEPWKVRGKGLAVLMKGPAIPPNTASSAVVRFNEDASIELMVGTSEMGQGTLTSLTQMVAERLRVPMEKIRVASLRGTASTMYTWQTVGSRGLFMDGRAVLEANKDAESQIKQIASQVLHVSEEDLELAEEKVRVREEPWRSLTLAEVVMGYMYPGGNSIGGPVVGRGSYIATGLSVLDPDTGQGNPAVFETFGCQGAEVEVNVLTGQVEILKAFSAFDIGRAINPLLVEGQVYGGTVMASSIALFEQLIYQEGVLLNPHFLDYKIARMSDAPEDMVSISVENPQEDGPYGARGIGELTMIGMAAALGNAVSNALNIEIKDLPMTPENVWKAVTRQNPKLLERAKRYLKGE